jgi:hypothetical protein
MSNNMKVSYENWVFKNEMYITTIFNKIVCALKNDTISVYPVMYMNIDEANLYKDLSNYLYMKSNNSHKHYCA